MIRDLLGLVAGRFLFRRNALRCHLYLRKAGYSSRPSAAFLEAHTTPWILSSTNSQSRNQNLEKHVCGVGLHFFAMRGHGASGMMMASTRSLVIANIRRNIGRKIRARRSNFRCEPDSMMSSIA